MSVNNPKSSVCDAFLNFIMLLAPPPPRKRGGGKKEEEKGGSHHVQAICDEKNEMVTLLSNRKAVNPPAWLMRCSHTKHYGGMSNPARLDPQFISTLGY